MGVAISLFTLALLLAVTYFGGDLLLFAEIGQGVLQQRDARLALCLCALVGLIPASQLYMVRVTEENLRALDPLLGRGSEPLELPRPSFWFCILPGILASPVIAYGIDRDFGFYFTPEYLSPIHAFQWGVGFFCSINAALITHLTHACARALASRAEAMPHVDLLDLTPLAPFARQSLQQLLVWLSLLSIFSVNGADPDFFLPVLGMSVLCLGNAGLGAWRCNVAVHRRIQDAKREELARLNAALRREPNAQLGLALASPDVELSVGDLLEYRRFVEESREWAFDSSAWLRSALYLAIPLGSWLGGAVLDRALEASLR